MNLKLRFMNKPVLIAIVSATVAFVYQVLSLIGTVPAIAEEEVVKLFGIIINILVVAGILTDPTTAGLGDSAKARIYDEPKKVTAADESFPMGGEDKDVVDALIHEADDPEDPEV